MSGRETERDWQDGERETDRTVPTWRAECPSTPVGSRPDDWLLRSAHKRGALPQTPKPFTMVAIDEQRRMSTIKSALYHGAIARIGRIKPYNFDHDLRGRSTDVSVYQLTERAWEWFDDHADEHHETTLPCDCAVEGFTNLGTLDGAPFDEMYYACNDCGRAFPESEVRG